MLTRETCKGLWSGMLVPWTADDRVDEARFRRHIRKLCAAAKGHGLYSHGTTGEFYAQTFEEWQLVASTLVEEGHANGSPVQVGVTDLSTRTVIRKVELAAQMGADAVQVAFPFWLQLTPDEGVRFYRDLAAAVPGMAMVVYGTARAKLPTTVDWLRRVLDAGVPVVGCKYAGSLDDLPQFIRALPEISFLVGETGLATAMQMGARGSCAAYVYTAPRYMVKYFSLGEAGKWDEALAIQNHLKEWHKKACAHLFAKKLMDSALDRVFAHAAGFIDVEYTCQPPYSSATAEDVRLYTEICEREFPEMLHDIPAAG